MLFKGEVSHEALPPALISLTYHSGLTNVWVFTEALFNLTRVDVDAPRDDDLIAPAQHAHPTALIKSAKVARGVCAALCGGRGELKAALIVQREALKGEGWERPAWRRWLKLCADL